MPEFGQRFGALDAHAVQVQVFRVLVAFEALAGMVADLHAHRHAVERDDVALTALDRSEEVADASAIARRLTRKTETLDLPIVVLGIEDDQIVAWATAKDHEKIKGLIDQFGEEAASEIVVYSLKNITAANASTVLQTALPQANIMVDADNPGASGPSNTASASAKSPVETPFR